MASTKSEKSIGLFEKFYGMSKDLKDAAKKPIIESKLRRRIESAQADCRGQIIDVEFAIAELKENVTNLDINAIIAKASVLKSLNETLGTINDLYLEMFAEEIK